jgi:hypothetical protein
MERRSVTTWWITSRVGGPLVRVLPLRFRSTSASARAERFEHICADSVLDLML